MARCEKCGARETVSTYTPLCYDCWLQAWRATMREFADGLVEPPPADEDTTPSEAIKEKRDVESLAP